VADDATGTTPTQIIDHTVQTNPVPDVGQPQFPPTAADQIDGVVRSNPLPHVDDAHKAVVEALAKSTAVPSVGDLPWATVLMPTTSAGQGGIGQNRHELQVETWVYGFFLDGPDGQQPVVLGVWPGGPGAGTAAGGGGGITTNPTGNGTAQPDNRPVSDKELSAVRYLMGKGYTSQQAAGIVANLSLESGMSTTVLGDDGTAIGLAQWRLDRRSELQRRPNWNTMEGQLDFVDYELKTYPRFGGAELRNATSPSRAAEVFTRKYERPRDPDGDSAKRAARAEEIHRRLMNSPAK